MKFLVHRRTNIADQGSATDIALVDATTGLVETVATPPAGFSYQRPIVNQFGDISWYQLEKGGSTDNPWSMFGVQLVNRASQSKPVAKPWWWLAQGHAEFSPSGWQLVQAVWEWFTADFKIVASDFTQSVNSLKVIAPIGNIEPSWHGSGRIVFVKKGKPVSQFVVYAPDGKVTTYAVSGPEPKDPYLTPDGLNIIYQRPLAGVRIYNLATKQDRWVIQDTGGWTSSQARPLDNSTAYFSRKAPGDMYYCLYTVLLDGSGVTTRITGKADGSIEQPVLMLS